MIKNASYGPENELLFRKKEMLQLLLSCCMLFGAVVQNGRVIRGIADFCYASKKHVFYYYC